MAGVSTYRKNFRCCEILIYVFFVIVSGLALRDIITRSARYCRAPRYIIARGAVAGKGYCALGYDLQILDYVLSRSFVSGLAFA